MNVALPAGTGDEGWLRAFHAVVPELLADFRPQVLVTQHGADTHFEDPLAHLAVSLDAQRAVQEACHELAHEYATTDAGSRSAAAGTRWWTWCRGRGRIWWGSRRHAPGRSGVGDPGVVAGRGVRADAAVGAAAG